MLLKILFFMIKYLDYFLVKKLNWLESNVGYENMKIRVLNVALVSTLQ